MSVGRGVTTHFRNFSFFDAEKLADRVSAYSGGTGPDRGSTSSKKDDGGLALFEDFEPLPAMSGTGNGIVVYGGMNGELVLINRDLQLVKFKSHSETVNRLCICRRSEVLVVLGNHMDIPGGRVEPFINIFSLGVGDIDEINGPRLLKSFRVFNDAAVPEPILTMTALSDCSQIALGTANGTVLIFDLELTISRSADSESTGAGDSRSGRDRGSTVADGSGGDALFTGGGRVTTLAIPKAPVMSRLFEGDPSLASVPVTGLHYRESADMRILKAKQEAREASDSTRKYIRAKSSSVLTATDLPELDILYIITVDRVIGMAVPQKTSGVMRGGSLGSRGRTMKSLRTELIDQGGCDMNCSTIDDNGRLVVAKSETIHLYSGFDRRGLHAFPGDKRLILAFKRYLIVVCAHKRVIASGDSAHLLSGGAGGGDLAGKVSSIPSSGSVRSEVTIYDNENKYIAYRKVIDSLIDIVCEWNSVLVLTGHELVRLRDKELQEKLKELFDSHLYQKGIDLARSEGADEHTIMDYYRQYGDWLYHKGEYQQAMEQYVRTIAVSSPIEPSYVIRKYLDAQKIFDLTQYLTELHNRGQPSADHTTLLLNCYTKLKDKRKLDEFINPSNSDSNPKFDVDTAIRVCREAGLLSYARILAIQQGKHSVVIELLFEEASNAVAESSSSKEGSSVSKKKKKQSRSYLATADGGSGSSGTTSGMSSSSSGGSLSSSSISADDRSSKKPGQMDDEKSSDLKEDAIGYFEEALNHIAMLDFINAERLMKRFGKRLLQECPKKSTELLKSLCTDFSEKYEFMLASKTMTDDDVRNGSLTRASSGMTDSSIASTPGTGSGSRSLPVAQKLKAKPEDFIHLFVGRREQLKDFLGFLVRNDSRKCSTMVLNTLLEIYMKDAFDLRHELSLYNSKFSKESGVGFDSKKAEGRRDSSTLDVAAPTKEDRKKVAELTSQIAELETKTMRILRAPSEYRYDQTHSLALAKMYQMEAAVIYLYESMHLYHEIIQHYRDSKNDDAIIKVCREFTRQDSSLWTHAFTYFIRKGSESHVKMCLNQIASLNLLPPLMIIELLSQSVNTSVTIDVLRDYLIRDLTLEQNRISDDSREIDRLKSDIREMEQSMHDLTTKAKTFQSTKCAMCLCALELPTVHFLCGHSCHERCAGTSNGHHITSAMASSTVVSAAGGASKSHYHCLKCFDQFDEVFARQRDMQRTRFEHDRFFSQLKSAHDSGDAFDKVSEYFGRGVIH